jgi:acetolactate synthase-1/2/3 large subunit
MVRQWQQLFFDKRYAEMINPNFIAIAEGYIKAKKSAKREDLDAAVAEMMASKESYFLEVMVEKKITYSHDPTGASVSDIRLINSLKFKV